MSGRNQRTLEAISTRPTQATVRWNDVEALLRSLKVEKRQGAGSRVRFSRDTVIFEGKSVDEIAQAFRDAVTDYLETCAEIGKAPERAYSGKIPLRIDPELHRRIAIEAESNDSSLNGWISEILSKKTASG